ncbi:MAG: hypothetical protein QOI58_1907 [Thermoanaerobaculia bacterium]|jgi:hypothetical protein|nr:hypothetical protein [Thermoanaerobaculia bacterium]
MLALFKCVILRDGTLHDGIRASGQRPSRVIMTNGPIPVKNVQAIANISTLHRAANPAPGLNRATTAPTMINSSLSAIVPERHALAPHIVNENAFLDYQ